MEASILATSRGVLAISVPAVLPNVQARGHAHECFHLEASKLRPANNCRQSKIARKTSRPALDLHGDSRSVKLGEGDRKSTRLNSSHVAISYAVFCLKKKIEVIEDNLACHDVSG